MTNEESDDDVSEWVKKCLRSNIKMFETLLEALECQDEQCREAAHNATLIIFEHIQAALEELNCGSGRSIVH